MSRSVRVLLRTLLVVALVASALAVGSLPAAAPAEAQTAGWIPGIDVASHQHPGGAAIDWGAVARSGQRFAMVKASEGTSYRNPYFLSDSYEARRVGIYVGAYHYARPKHPIDASARAEAAYFADTMAAAGDMRAPGWLPPTLDLEEHGGLSRTDLARWTEVFLAEIGARTGTLPILYTGSYFWNTHVGSTAFARYPLWLANYTSGPQPTYLPTGWPTWTFWQWTSTGTIPGIVGNVDRNRFGGGEAGFTRLISGRMGQAPIGHVDRATPVAPGKVRVSGWAFDLDDPTTVADVHIYVGDRGHAVSADDRRPDVDAVHGTGHGPGNGFDVTLDLPPGRHRVCAYGIEAFGGGGNSLLGCRHVGGDPVGEIRTVRGGPRGGEVTVEGWAVDPETSRPVPVHVYVGGRGTAVLADQPDPKGFGTSGFRASVPGAPGARDVCIAAVNVSGTPGSTTWLGCHRVSVPTGDPVGNLETARQDGPRRITVSGWAFDPDVTTATPVHVYVNGRGAATVADRQRPDVNAAHHRSGPSGFTTTVAADPGWNHVCVAAINSSGTAGTNRWLRCRDVHVSSGSPFGAVDLVAAGPAGVRATGWAADPDTGAPIDVHVYVGATGVATTADRARPDVAAATGWPAARGFDVTVPVGPGLHQVCIAAINAGGTPGGNVWLDCRTVRR